MKQTKIITKERKVSGDSQSYQFQSKFKTSNSPNNQKGLGQSNSLDLKKINLNKNPNDSNSSLELLILLLNKCLKMSLQQILGLFTNNNKFLAHIIVKGINQDFKGIRQFYQELNQNIETLMRLYNEDQEDAFACFYAIKPGFISKDQRIVQLTIQFFMNFPNIYDWFVSSNSKCSATLLLGFKRHQSFNELYSKVLFKIIQGKQMDFFINHYAKSISSPIQTLGISSKLARILVGKTIQIQQQEKNLVEQLQKGAVFQSWFQIAQELYQSHLQNKLLALQFLGEVMLWLPQVIQKNQTVLNLIRQNWVKYELIVFIPLFNQLLITLEKLANAKSLMSRKLYTVVVGIFNDTYHIEDKKDYIVNGFMTILSQFPSIPSDMFIKNYHIGKLNPSDFILICEAIDISEDINSLIKIGDVVKDIFLAQVLQNYFLANLMPQVVRKVIRIGVKQSFQFLNSLTKSILSHYVTVTFKLKSFPRIVGEETYFGKKKKQQKSAQLQKMEVTQLNKKADLLLSLCEKIIDTVLTQKVEESYITSLKNYILIANSQVKKNNFGRPNKKVMGILQKKLGLTKQEQLWFEEQSKQNVQKQGPKNLSESVYSRRSKENYSAIASLSRIQVPDKVTKEFQSIIARRKKDQENRAQDEMRKNKQQEMKKLLFKKEILKMGLIKGGFGEGQAQIKQEGFWNKFIKETEEIQVFPNESVEDVYLQAADLIIKRHSKVLKFLFFNYSNSMYSVKASNFDENLQRKQTLSAVQLTKLLKDYKLMFLTNSQEIQTLVRQINVKILARKQIVGELDYQGFQQFIRQFCLIVWSRNQRLQPKQSKQPKQQKEQPQSLKLDHLNLPELIKNFLQHLKQVFRSKGEGLGLFQNSELQSETTSAQLEQINQKLKENPSYILPIGLKKIVDKKIDFKSQIKSDFSLPQSYKTCFEILDQIIFQKLSFHFIEPRSQKVTKVTAKVFHQINVRDRDPTKIKARALSTIIDRKMSSQSYLGHVLTKNDLSKGVKKALLSIRNQDKIVGEQVALTLQEMLIKIDAQKSADTNSQISKMKNLNKENKSDRRRGVSQQQLETVNNVKIKKIPSIAPSKFVQKLNKQIQQKKLQRQQEEKRKLQQQELKMKRKKQLQQKYYQQQKLKIQEKRRLEETEQLKKKRIEQERKLQKKKNKEKFQQFNIKQVDRLKKDFLETVQKRKKNDDDKEFQNEENQEKMKKIRNKIENQDKLISQIRKETLEAINEIQFSQPFLSLVKQHEESLKPIFQYLQRLTFKPLADKKCKPQQIDFQTWTKFNKIFQISPLIVNPKDMISIFKAVTKDKRVAKEYHVGLNYDQFLQCLLRQCIKQKTIFRKIFDKIKEDEPVSVNAVNKKQKAVVKVQTKNQFQQDEETDVKKLLKQPDVRQDIIDHYGDVSKFSIQDFKGLIYYLRMPFTKKGQQARIKELTETQRESEASTSNIQKLKQKLKVEFTLERKQKKQKNTSKPQVKDKQTPKQEAANKQKKQSKKLKLDRK